MKKGLIENVILIFFFLFLCWQLINNTFFLWFAGNMIDGKNIKNKLLKLSIDKDPSFLQPHYSQMLFYSEHASYQDVIDKYNEIKEKFPQDVMCRYILGLINLKEGKIDSAMCDFSQVISFDHDFAWAFYERSKMYQKQGNTKRYLVDKIKFLELLRKNEKAIEYINQFIKEYPEDPWGIKFKNIVEKKIIANQTFKSTLL